MNGIGLAADGQQIALRYEGQRIRFAGTSEKPAWIAVDVCDVLDIKNPSQALAGLDDDEKGLCTTYTVNGKQTLLTVYESGLYNLILRSRKPEAKKFRKWVVGEVLPSLRKYGTYPPPEGHEFRISLKPYTARVVWVTQARRQLKPGYWCVFIEGAEMLIAAEQIMGPADLEMKQYDLLDGSIGSHWGKYRDDKPWAMQRIPYQYTFPSGDKRGTVRPWSYAMSELEHFKNWLHTEYYQTHFPKYLKDKYGAANFQRALPVFASLGIPLPESKRKK